AHLFGDTDDGRARRVLFAEVDAFADRILARPEQFRHAVADHDDRRGDRSVAGAEPASTQNPRPNGPEVVRVARLQNEAAELSDRVYPFDKESTSFIAPEGNRGHGGDERDARNASRRLDESAPQRVRLGGTETSPAPGGQGREHRDARATST